MEKVQVLPLNNTLMSQTVVILVVVILMAQRFQVQKKAILMISNTKTPKMIQFSSYSLSRKTNKE